MNDTHSPVVCLVTIVDRGKGRRVTDVLRMAGVAVQLVLLGQGTASTEMMDCLGLDGPEKDVVISLACGPRTAALLDRLTPGGTGRCAGRVAADDRLAGKRALQPVHPAGL